MEEVGGAGIAVKRASKITKSSRSIFVKSTLVNLATMAWIAGSMNLQGPHHDMEKNDHEQFGSLLDGIDGWWFEKISNFGFREYENEWRKDT